jgi:ubiquinol-cytochrome c reductase cytochrome b subunit
MWNLQGNIAAFLKRFLPGRRGNRTQNSRSGRPLAVLAWWAFLFALFSGVILSFNYRPWGDVFKSVSKITGWHPYGVFFRRLHYLSGQSFLLFTLAHTFEHFLRGTFRRIKPLEWTKLVLLFYLSFPLVFTGFILKGDKEGILAGQVMYHLAREIPFIGSGLARILISPGEEFFLLPYLHHTVILPLMVIFILGEHRRRLLPRGELGLPLLAILALFATFYPLGPDIPPHMEISHIAGPWFFHGIQLVLRYGPAFWAGVIWPLSPLVLLAALSFLPSSLSRPGWWLTAVAWLLHVTVLIAAWFTIPGFTQGAR